MVSPPSPRGRLRDVPKPRHLSLPLDTPHAGSCGTGFPRNAGCFLLVLVLLPLACKREQKTGITTQPATKPAAESFVESHNRAVGLMGRFEFDAAANAFEAFAKSHPDHPDIRTNQAISML